MKKKVLFFLFGGCGGAERMTLNIAKMLPLDQYDVQLVICGKRTEVEPFLPKELPHIRIPWRNIYVFPRLRLLRVLHREKPDFVFSSTMALNVLLLQVSRFVNAKFIVRNDNNLCYVDSKMQRKLAKYYPRAFRVIAQQEEMQRDIINLIGTDDKHVIALQNPVDTKLIDRKLSEGGNPYPQDDSINYLWVGNYLPAKGHDILAEAFKIVHANNPKTHLYFAGSIIETFPNYIKTKKIVEDSGLQDYVHFLGQQSNPYVWMKYADCFVLPSRMEGLPNVLIEAMYCGTPVVASVCIPVIERMVEEGYNGYKVKPEDPAAMAMAMEKAIRLRDFRMTYKSATREDFINIFQIGYERK